MATLIRFKRKKSSGDSGVKLKSGEPYYNLQDHKLFVGNNDEDDVTQKKHIAQITQNDSNNTPEIEFTIGDDASGNKYSKTINNVSVAKGLILDDDNYGTRAEMEALTSPEKGQVFFMEAE